MGTVVTADNTLGTLVDNGDGTWTWSLLATDPLNDGPKSGTIVVTGTASNGSSITTSFAYSIANVAPTATFNVADPGRRGRYLRPLVHAPRGAVGGRHADLHLHLRRQSARHQRRQQHRLPRGDGGPGRDVHPGLGVRQ